MSATAKPVPPVARKVPVRIEQLGRVRVDDYAWMKDDNWQKVLRDPSLIKADVRDHLTAENAYAKAMLASTEALQTQMFEEMKGRIKEDDSSVPASDGPWDYYSRYEKGAEQPIFARRPRGAETGEQVMLDADAAAKGKAEISGVRCSGMARPSTTKAPPSSATVPRHGPKTESYSNR